MRDFLDCTLIHFSCKYLSHFKFLIIELNKKKIQDCDCRKVKTDFYMKFIVNWTHNRKVNHFYILFLSFFLLHFSQESFSYVINLPHNWMGIVNIAGFWWGKQEMAWISRRHCGSTHRQSLGSGVSNQQTTTMDADGREMHRFGRRRRR